MAVKIDRTSLDQLLKIRDSGLTNMFNFDAVQRIAYEENYFELVNWMEDNKSGYANLIIYGPEEVDEDTDGEDADNGKEEADTKADDGKVEAEEDADSNNEEVDEDE